MRVVLLAATAFVSIAQSAAEAQAPIERGNNQSVTQRPRPDYDPLGLRLGSFEVLPTLTLGAESNDNIFASATAERDDIIFSVRPEVAIASDWMRNALRFSVGSTSAFHQDYDSEDYTDLNVLGDFRLDVGSDGNVGIGGDYFNGTESRADPDNPQQAVEPVEYSHSTGYLYGAYTFNRVRVSGRAEVGDYDYDNAVNAVGAPINLQFRDHTENLQTVRVEYAVSPATALVLQGQTNQMEYDVAPPGSLFDRDSTGYSILVGANTDLTNLIRGEVTVGYLSQDWDHTNLSIEGLAVNANLEYFVTRLTTITLTGRRAVEDSGLDFFSAVGRVATRVGARVDHELLRNVLLTAGVRGGTDEYTGIDRDDDVLDADAGVSYLLNRHASLGARYLYTDVQSSGLNRDRDFSINRFLLSLTLKL